MYYRMQTDTEIGKLQNDTKEAFERENRGLREARDLAVQQRDQVTLLLSLLCDVQNTN